MSAGDIDNTAWSERAVLEEFKRDPELAAYVMTHKYVDDQYDIPFVGGISTDGQTPYLDRHFPRWGKLKDTVVDYGHFIGNYHEAPEWFMVVKRNFSYLAAHHFANGVEDWAVTRNGYDPKEYNAYIDKFVSKIEHEKIIVTPRNLALYPYQTDKKLLAKIKERMS